jgi:ribosomal protein L32E
MAGGASVRKRMSRLGHSRPGRADSKSSHFRYAPIANKFRSPAKCRKGANRRHGRWHAYSGTLAFLKPANIPSYKPASSGYSRAVVSSLSELALLLARQTAAELITWSRA